MNMKSEPRQVCAGKRCPRWASLPLLRWHGKAAIEPTHCCRSLSAARQALLWPRPRHAWAGRAGLHGYPSPTSPCEKCSLAASLLVLPAARRQWKQCHKSCYSQCKKMLILLSEVQAAQQLRAHLWQAHRSGDGHLKLVVTQPCSGRTLRGSHKGPWEHCQDGDGEQGLVLHSLQ